MAAPAKQAQLVGELAKGVQEILAPEFAKTGAALAQLTALVNQVIARLEMLDTAAGAAPKRAVRGGAAPAGAAGKKAAAPRAGAKKGVAGSDATKVTNALLFFRYALASDLLDMRDTYATDAACQEAEQDATMSKKDRKKDEAGYYSVLGAFLWKNNLNDEEKSSIRTQFTTWKESSAREDADQQLEEDGEDVVGE